MTNFFGTDGIRTRCGTGLLTREKLPLVGKAIALWALKRHANPRILIAHDTRLSCSFVKAALKTGLCLYPVIISDAFVLPTPALFHIMHKTGQFDYAVVISASHNPFYDNGIKIISAHEGKITDQDEQEISELIKKLESNNNYPEDYNLLGTDTPFFEAQELYCQLVTQFFTPKFLVGKKIVLDCAQGATYHVAPKIFAQLGAQVIAINNTPNGININNKCGSLEPELLQQKVIQENADAGFAFDGDGDRVIAVSKNGLCKNGDFLLALLSEHTAYKNNTTIIGTVMSNYGFEEWLYKKNKNLVRTPVGDKYIINELHTTNTILGGEQSGHIIVKDLCNTGDGIVVALRVLELLCTNNNWEMETFEWYPQILINIPVARKTDLAQEPYAHYIQEAQRIINGRIIVRFSGTEPLLRVMVEAAQLAEAQKVGQELASHITDLLNQVS